MFKTLTAAKILVKQSLYDDALAILADIENESNRLKVSYLRAACLEGLNRNDEAEELCYRLIDARFVEENVYEILEKIFSKKKHSESEREEDVPEAEMASAYEMLGDNENALKWYYRKIESLKRKIESEES